MTNLTNRNANHDYWTERVEGNPILRNVSAIGSIAIDYAAGTEQRPFLFVGDPGCGKTTAIKSKLKAANRSFAEIKSGGSLEGFADRLQECARTGTFVFCDDANDILRKSGHLQVLMTATLPQRRGERRIYEKPLQMGKNAKPRLWCFDNLVMCFMSNEPQSVFAPEPQSAEMRAVLDRCTYIEQEKSSPEQMFNYVAYMAIVCEYLKPLGCTIEMVNTGLEFITEHRGETKLSLRGLEDLVVSIKSSPQRWRATAQASLKKTRTKVFDVPEMPRIIPAMKMGKKIKFGAQPTDVSMKSAPAPAFYCAFSDMTPQTAFARAKAMAKVLDLHAERMPMNVIIEQVQHDTFVQVTEEDVRSIVEKKAA